MKPSGDLWCPPGPGFWKASGRVPGRNPKCIRWPPEHQASGRTLIPQVLRHNDASEIVFRDLSSRGAACPCTQLTSDPYQVVNLNQLSTAARIVCYNVFMYSWFLEL
jgi:hypothetical protein